MSCRIEESWIETRQKKNRCSAPRSFQDSLWNPGRLLFKNWVSLEWVKVIREES